MLKVAFVTVRAADALTAGRVVRFTVAEMLTGLGFAARPLASPLPLTVATEVLDEVQEPGATRLVRFAVRPSLNKPVTANRVAVPWAIWAVAGVMEIEARLSIDTVRPVVAVGAVTLATVQAAEMFADPGALAEAKPLRAVTVAMADAEELQLQMLEMS